MVNPVNAGESKGDGVERDGREHGVKPRNAVLMWDLELQHHDSDDDGNDAIREGFKTGRTRDMVGHREGFCIGSRIQRGAGSGATKPMRYGSDDLALLTWEGKTFN